jgi:hypothetical protein
MARTMFAEYKTSDRIWTEVVNTTCHATNRLYLYKLLKKTSYEILLVKSQMYLTFKFLEASALFSKRGQNLINLLLKYMKGSYLVMIQTLTHIMSSTRTPVVL